MKKLFFLLVFLISANLFAQSPQGRNFGFGLVVGDPTGLTVKFWTQRENAFNIDIGAS
jgi:hypothetical protein